MIGFASGDTNISNEQNEILAFTARQFIDSP
jgi:hypothetical protein